MPHELALTSCLRHKLATHTSLFEYLSEKNVVLNS